MKVNISSVHFKADKSLENFITDRVSKLSSFYEGVLGGDVVLRLDNSDNKEKKVAEIKLSVKGAQLFAKKQSKSFEESTDSAIEALRRQLVKHKGKISSKK